MMLRHVPHSLLLGISLVGLALPARSAEDVDALFARARTLAFSGRRPEAMDLCRRALLQSPGYADIRILLGRIQAWEGHYAEARLELQRVLREAPDHEDGRVALVDLELWSDHPQVALTLCDEGLLRKPAQPLLVFRRARALKALGDFPAAMAASNQALALDPGLHEARQYSENLAELIQRNKIFLGYTYDRFDRTFEPWRVTTLSASHRFDAGSLIGRVNLAQRFGDTGQQLEVDAYPRWGDGTYFYLNAGYSSASIFPRHSYGAELYHNFPRGIETSLGLRLLKFSASDVTIYTGSLGKYWGDYLFTLRAYDTPSAIGTSLSGSLAIRKYFGDGDTYLALSLGTGISPDQPGPDAELLKLRSRKVSLSGQGWIQRRLILSGGVAYQKQEIGPGIERAQSTLNLGLEWRF